MKSRLMLALLIGAAVTLLVPVSTALAQTEDDINTLREGANHMKNMGAFIDGCILKKQLGDTSVIAQCVAVYKDFNEHMTQLFADNREVIGKITFG